MPSFSDRSNSHKKELHILLQLILNTAIEVYDFSVIEGHRPEEEQNELYNATPRRTKVQWPDSKHNKKPSLAVDICPYLPGLDIWDLTNTEVLKQWYHLSGIIKGIAALYQIDIRWGGDWDSDNEFDDNRFDDLPHFELVLPE